MVRNIKYDHNKVVTGTNDATKQVSKDAWNDGHDELGMFGHGTPTTLTIATGAITPINSMHLIDGQGGSADNLDSITNTETVDRDELWLIKGVEVITVRDNSVSGGNIFLLNGNTILLDANRPLRLIRSGTNWHEFGGGGSGTFLDSKFLVQDEGDTTKQWDSSVGGATTGTKTTLAFSQTLNRTIAFPDATDTMVGKATTDIFTNKSIDANGTGNVITNIGDAEIEAHTTTKITTTAKGQLNSAIVYNDQTNVFGDFDQDFKDNRIRIFNPTDTFAFTFIAPAIIAARNITLPLLTGDDIFVTESFIQTLTNKTINTSNNTITVNLADVSDVTMTVADLNSLDNGVNSTLHFHDSDRARADHTGSQLASTISDFDTQVRTSTLNQMAAPTADLSINNNKLTNVIDPTTGQEAATKNYVDNIAINGVKWKESARVATTVNITLSGEQTIDGVSTSADRILVKNQTLGEDNGVYISDAGAWVRSTDTDTSAEILQMAIFTEEGTVNADQGFVLTTDAPITLGTTPLTYTQFTGLGQITAGIGLTKTGNIIDVGGTTNRISVSADAVDIDSTYVGQSSITTLGTIVTGVWNATAITGANINAASTDLTDTDDIVLKTQANTYGDFLQTFKDNRIKINSPDDVDGVTLVNSNQTADRNLTIPILTGNRNFVVTTEASQIVIGTEVTGASTDLTDTANIVLLNAIQTFTANNEFLSGGLRIRETAGSFQFIFNTTDIGADRNITLPALGANDVFVFEAFAQTLTNKTITLGSNTLSGTVTQFNTALASETFAYIGVANAWGAVNQNITATGGWQEAGVNISPIGTHTQSIPAGAWGTVTTNGAEFAELELPTNDIMLQTFNFDQTTSEKIQFWWEPPAEWNAGTITFNVKWTAASGSGTVIWTLSGHSYSNDDAIDAAIGGTPASTSADTLLLANDMHITSESGNVTINGATKGESVLLQLSRDISDTLSADAKLIGINITFTVDEATKD